MAANLHHLFPRPTSHRCVSFRRLNTRKHKTIAHPPPFKSSIITIKIKTDHRNFQGSASRGVDQISTTGSTVDINRYVDFLYADLPNVFGDRGIDQTMYDERIRFRDPMTESDTLSDYLSYIAILKKIFRPEFNLHYVKQTGPYEITTRWTVVMNFVILPWEPQLVLNGTSILAIDPETRKFCTSVDLWDSIENNDYFSVEALLDIIKQSLPLQVYKSPDMESYKYQILKRTANYEIRKYSPFVIAEAKREKVSGSVGFTQAFEIDPSKIASQNVLLVEKDFSSSPGQNEEHNLRKVKEGFAVVSTFGGNPTEEIVRDNERRLRLAVLEDGLKPKEGCLLVPYNDSCRTLEFMMRNEVLIWLEEFTLD